MKKGLLYNHMDITAVNPPVFVPTVEKKNL